MKKARTPNVSGVITTLFILSACGDKSTVQATSTTPAIKTSSPGIVGSPLPETRVTTSGSVFTRVTDHPELGAEVWQLGNLIWGDAVVLPDGEMNDEETTTRQMNHQEAIAYCGGLGARLPTQEEFLQLRLAMGAEVDVLFYLEPPGYQPQVLPHLNDWFWSSSVFPIGDDLFYGFNGRIGGLDSGYPDDNEAVRCVVGR